MDIVRVEGLDEGWDAFVWESPAGTIFSTLRFLSYHPPSRFDSVNFAVKDGADLVCAVAGGVVEAAEGAGRYFRSPVGASFGGPVLKDDLDLGRTIEVVDAFTSRLREMGLRGIELVLPPPCYSRQAEQGLGFSLMRSGYRVVGREATMVIDLENFRRDDLDPVLRRNLRKAEKEGVYVHATTRLEGFYGVLAANLAAKGARPTHSLEELETLFSLYPDRFILLEAAVKDRVVGGCLVVICNSRAGLAFYICDDRDYSHVRASEATLVSAVGLLQRSGCKYLDLGTVSTGSDVNWGLARFKSKFAPITQVRERYVLGFEEVRA
jgi:hypothetical protein